MIELIKDIQPRGIASAYVVAPFDKGKELLEANGYHIISAEENAKLRVREGKDAYVSQYGNWTKEDFLYVPKKGNFFTKNSPIMTNPAEATQAHRERIDFYLTPEQVEWALSNSVKLKNKDFSIPTKKFGSDKLTVFSFGSNAQIYGDFLNNLGIKEMDVYVVDNIGDKPFVRKNWFAGLNSSGLGGGRRLDSGTWVRGVYEDASASEPSQKNLYSYAQISKTLDELGFSGLKSGLLKKLG